MTSRPTIVLQLVATVVLAAASVSAQTQTEGPYRVHEVGRKEGRQVFAVDVTDPAAPRRLTTFSNATQKVKSTHWSREADRLLILGETGAAQMITVLITTSGVLVDEFFVLNASVSPSGRWASFQRFEGRGAPYVGAIYAIYDTALNPAENRPQTEAGSTMNVGLTVYPVAAGRQPQVLTSGGEGVHISMSPLFWTSAATVAFIDRVDFEPRLVTVNVRAGAREADVKTQALDVGRLGDSQRIAPGEHGARFLSATSIAATEEDGVFVVTFRPQPEVRIVSTRVRVW